MIRKLFLVVVILALTFSSISCGSDAKEEALAPSAPGTMTRGVTPTEPSNEDVEADTVQEENATAAENEDVEVDTVQEESATAAEGEFDDILTPNYYQSWNDEFRDEIDNFIFYARKERLLHPLNDIKDEIEIPVSGRFGAGKGPGGNQEHHPAVDLHPVNTTSEIKIYASHDGYLTAHTDLQKYRNHIAIVKDIFDNDRNFIGKLVTIYAHLDLDKDLDDLIDLNNQYVNKGDLISQNLYSETVGGPHLHFEIRYYRSSDSGLEEFYGVKLPSNKFNLTLPSAGKWTYGYWNEDIGYGYADPGNHGLNFKSSKAYTAPFKTR